MRVEVIYFLSWNIKMLDNSTKDDSTGIIKKKIKPKLRYCYYR